MESPLFPRTLGRSLRHDFYVSVDRAEHILPEIRPLGSPQPLVQWPPSRLFTPLGSCWTTRNIPAFG